jgi:hypothetical protein
MTDVEAGVALVPSIAKGSKKSGSQWSKWMSAWNIMHRIERAVCGEESVAKQLERVTSLVDNNAQSAKDAKLAAEELADRPMN